jgi:hypothetical protein
MTGVALETVGSGGQSKNLSFFRQQYGITTALGWIFFEEDWLCHSVEKGGRSFSKISSTFSKLRFPLRLDCFPRRELLVFSVFNEVDDSSPTSDRPRPNLLLFCLFGSSSSSSSFAFSAAFFCALILMYFLTRMFFRARQ